MNNNMEQIEVKKYFSEQDKEFNRMLVKEGMCYNHDLLMPERRGGKMQINNNNEPSILKDKDYDFSSDIIEQFSRKWGLSE